ncbi:hypothetical protein BI364_10265 [Acidihalobacter yilgarnensis]|uniref:Uncharacterized protein n=1 Tax=Acidihalobacter yilgarnensis TaxID=2819280 RepID=A0A1D8IPB7_9GAMM|nr:hypothetical protein BI364_10265 [Acidihalobacter yilgarnensis]
MYATPKSVAKSLPPDEAQGKRQPIRRWYACSFTSGARDVPQSMTSYVTNPLKPSAIAELCGPLRVVGPEHEVVDEQLRAPSEEVSQRCAPLVGLESIVLVDLNPWQLLPLSRQLVVALPAIPHVFRFFRLTVSAHHKWLIEPVVNRRPARCVA